MKKIKILLVSLLVCIVSIDILWFFFPEYISRKYAITFTIPIITVCYFLRVEVKRTLYLAALAAFMIGDYFFFIAGSLANGITSSSVALALYGIIVLKQSHYISTRRLLIGTIPFLGIYMLPFIFFVDRINDAIFAEVMFYTFTIGYFSLMSIMTYLSHINKVTQKLLMSGIATAIMGIMFGIYLFIDSKPIYSVFANFLFVYSHYKMWQYMIIKDAVEITEKESITL